MNGLSVDGGRISRVPISRGYEVGRSIQHVDGGASAEGQGPLVRPVPEGEAAQNGQAACITEALQRVFGVVAVVVLADALTGESADENGPLAIEHASQFQFEKHALDAPRLLAGFLHVENAVFEHRQVRSSN